MRFHFPVSKTEVRGRRNRIRGKLREKLGEFTNNRIAQLHGKAEQAEGRARESWGRAVRKTRNRL
jgi:uncharacterized protein YjbJ (UPF0337 family)